MFKEGFKGGKKLSLKEKREILVKLRKCSSVEDLKQTIKEYIEFPVFVSIVEEYEFLIGFLSAISYLTKLDLEEEILYYKDILNIKDIPNINNYYIAANRYFDKGYGKERIVITLRPKNGTLVKGKTRVPKIKDFSELKKIVAEFKDLLELYENIEDRKYKFFSKIS